MKYTYTEAKVWNTRCHYIQQIQSCVDGDAFEVLVFWNGIVASQLTENYPMSYLFVGTKKS